MKYKLYFIAFTIIMISFLIPTSASTYTNDYTTNQNTGISIHTTIDGTSVKLGSNFNVKIGLFISYFGSNVIDVHDVYLAVRLENPNTAFLQTLDKSFIGAITQVNYGFETVLTFSIPNDAPSTADLSIYAQFRENIPLSADPLSYVPWTSIISINFTSISSQSFDFIYLIIGAIVVGGIVIILVNASNSKNKSLNNNVQTINTPSIRQSNLSNYQNNANLMFCPNCGTQQDYSNNYCKKCGTKF